MNKHMVARSTAWLLILLWTALPAIAGGPESTPEQVDRIFSPLASFHSPGFAVLVRKNGKTLLDREYGLRDQHNGIDGKTNFRLASCTKQFTAMAVMLLVHDGKLRYDETLTEIFPEFPAYGRAITIRSLLTHTSGLPDYEELMEAAESGGHRRWSATQQIQDADVLQLLEAANRGKFAPGTKWSYSNSGYVVLGLVVAKASGMDFPGFLRQRIFEPLGMKRTLAYVHGANEIPSRAYGHSKEEKGFVETDQSATSATLGDGGVYSNLEDLGKWDDALRNYVLLSEGEMRAAWIPAVLADGTRPQWASGPGDSNPTSSAAVSYGFGWFLDPYHGHTRMWHYGDTAGFKSFIERFSDGLTIVILANRTDVDPGVLAAKVADLYLATH